MAAKIKIVQYNGPFSTSNVKNSKIHPAVLYINYDGTFLLLNQLHLSPFNSKFYETPFNKNFMWKYPKWRNVDWHKLISIPYNMIHLKKSFVTILIIYNWGLYTIWKLNKKFHKLRKQNCLKVIIGRKSRRKKLLYTSIIKTNFMDNDHIYYTFLPFE